MPIGGIGIPLSLKALKTNEVKLLAGEIYSIPPGSFQVYPGPYSFLQFKDPVSTLWRSVKQQTPNGPYHIQSDGANYRLANISGCPVGAVVTNAGTGYTSAPVVVSNAGGSLWTAIVGGLINATVTLPSFKGSNYTYPPIVILDAPPVGGIQATATAAISAGAITAVTIRDQGAGYVSSPRMYFLSDPRDPNNPVTNPGTATGITPIGAVSYDFAGAQAGYVDGIATITGANTISAVVCTDPGNAVTALPTLAFSGGGGASAAATVVMNWTVTGYTIGGGGVGVGTAAIVVTVGGLTAGTPVNTNPEIEQNLTQIRQANLGAAISGGVIASAGAVIDAGLGYQAVPTLIALGNGILTTAVTLTATVGGQTDVVYLISDDG